MGYINQINTAEKTTQVSLITELYENATHIMVWLGPSDPTTYLVTSLARQAPSSWERLGFGDVNLNDDRRAWDSFTTYAEMPHWNTIWIVQEICCGISGFTSATTTGDSVGQPVVGVAVGAVQKGDTVYRLAHMGIRLLFRPASRRYVGVAFIHPLNADFAEDDTEVYAKLELHHKRLAEVVSRGLRRIPPRLVGGTTQYDLVLDRIDGVFCISCLSTPGLCTEDGLVMATK